MIDEGIGAVRLESSKSVRPRARSWYLRFSRTMEDFEHAKQFQGVAKLVFVKKG